MNEIALDYLNNITSQMIFINSLLGGFSLTVVASLLDSPIKTSLGNKLFKTAIVATSSFLVSIFAMTKILMITTKGYPLEFEQNDLIFPRVVGVLSSFLGIISLTLMISISGWIRSKRIGIFTSIVGITSLLLIFLMLF